METKGTKRKAAERTRRPLRSLGGELRRRRRSVQRGCHFFDLVGLDDVADLDVVVVLEADAALVPGGDLTRIFLEATQRRELADVDLHRVADQSHLRVAAD